MLKYAVAVFFVTLLTFTEVWTWQQVVRYDIDVSLNAREHTLDGIERLTYINNSPDTLHFIWMHVYPNAYRDRHSVYAREAEIMGSYRFSFASPKERGYIDIKSITADGKPLQYEIEDTKMKVLLPQALAPSESLTFKIEFFVKIPKIFSRLGHVGKHYEITQWYPKPVVYDEKGWHPDGYHTIGEFYGEFGTFDVKITVPKNMVVGATGVLVSPSNEIAWLDSIAIEGAKLDSLKRGKRIKWPNMKRKQEGTKTLQFYAERVHDFAWVGDAKFRLIRDKYGETTINVLFLRKHKKYWKHVIDYAKDALKYYSNWYGEYPYSTLWVVDGKLEAGGGMEYPNLVIISSRGDPFTRLLEMVVMHEIGHQWFYGMLGSNEMDEAWLDEGINSFSEVRYMETKYGKRGNLFKYSRWLPLFNDRWFQTMMYYITATNKAERPILTPAYDFIDEPIAYQTAAYSKPAWVVDMLRYLVGDETFDKIMQEYCRRYRFRHPHTKDFIGVAEEVSGKDLTWFFDQWLRTTKVCDYRIKRVGVERRETKGEGFRVKVVVERKGEIVMPIDVLVETKKGEKLVKQCNGKERLSTLTFDTKSKIKHVIIDSENRLLEINKWNNRFPRKVSFRPLFDFPSFDSYQVLYGPSLSWNNTDGTRLGIWLHGHEFPDAELLKGRNNWSLSTSYGLKSKKLWYNAEYRTPLYFSKNNRIRLRMQTYNRWGEFGNKLTISSRIGKSIFSLFEHRLSLSAVLTELNTLTYVDTSDWEIGRTVGTNILYSYKKTGRNLSYTYKLGYQTAKEFLGSDYMFDKLFMEVDNHLRFTRNLFLDIRLFAGHIIGDAPSQDEFFLSGLLRPKGVISFIADRKGTLSSQERLHIPGDGNLRGYYGRHIHGESILAVNLETKLPKLPFNIFLDAGNIWPRPQSVGNAKLLIDCGLGIGLGPLEIDFPIWVSHPKEGKGNFNLRWILEIRELRFGIAM